VRHKHLQRKHRANTQRTHRHGRPALSLPRRGAIARLRGRRGRPAGRRTEKKHKTVEATYSSQGSTCGHDGVTWALGPAGAPSHAAAHITADWWDAVVLWQEGAGFRRGRLHPMRRLTAPCIAWFAPSAAHSPCEQAFHAPWR
jgi:hypothetical protein